MTARPNVPAPGRQANAELKLLGVRKSYGSVKAVPAIQVQARRLGLWMG